MKKLFTHLLLFVMLVFVSQVAHGYNYWIMGNPATWNGGTGNVYDINNVSSQQGLRFSNEGINNLVHKYTFTAQAKEAFFKLAIDANGKMAITKKGMGDYDVALGTRYDINGTAFSFSNSGYDAMGAFKLSNLSVGSKYEIEIDETAANYNPRYMTCKLVSGTPTPTYDSFYLVGSLLKGPGSNTWSEKNEDGQEFTTTDGNRYICVVNNSTTKEIDFRFRIGTSGNTKNTTYCPTNTTSGDGWSVPLWTPVKNSLMKNTSGSDKYCYVKMPVNSVYAFVFNKDDMSLYYWDLGDIYGKIEAGSCEMVVEKDGKPFFVKDFSVSRARKERDASMSYSTTLSTVGFKDESLPGKAGDKVRVYVRTKDYNMTLRPTVDGCDFGGELQPVGSYSSISSYKSEPYVINVEGLNAGNNAFVIEKGSGVSYTLALNLGDEIKTADGTNNIICHYVRPQSVSLFVNKSLAKVYKDVYDKKGKKYDETTETFYLIGAMDGGNYKSEEKDVADQAMEREVYYNKITNAVDSVVYSKVVEWKQTGASNLWFSFFPKGLYDNGTFGDQSKVINNGNNLWNYVARAQVQDEYDATAKSGCVNIAGYGQNLGNSEQALNPLVDEGKYKYYVVKFNVTTSTYRLEFYEDPVIDITKSKFGWIRTYSNEANIELPSDGSVRAYAVQAFHDQGKGTTAYGNKYAELELRRLKYIPARMGVVLFADESAVTNNQITNLKAKFSGLVSDDNKSDLWYDKDDKYAGETEFNNLLVPAINGIVIENGDYDEEKHEYETRNFALNYYSKTTEGKAHKDDKDFKDYLGFFRFEGKVKPGYAFLQLPKSICGYYLQYNGYNKDSEFVTQQEAKHIPYMGLSFDDDLGLTTGIQKVATPSGKKGDDGYYTLQGIKVANPVKGLYVHNGKVILIK